MFVERGLARFCRRLRELSSSALLSMLRLRSTASGLSKCEANSKLIRMPSLPLVQRTCNRASIHDQLTPIQIPRCCVRTSAYEPKQCLCSKATNWQKEKALLAEVAERVQQRLFESSRPAAMATAVQLLMQSLPLAEKHGDGHPASEYVT